MSKKSKSKAPRAPKIVRYTRREWARLNGLLLYIESQRMCNQKHSIRQVKSGKCIQCRLDKYGEDSISAEMMAEYRRYQKLLADAQDETIKVEFDFEEYRNNLRKSVSKE